MKIGILSDTHDQTERAAAAVALLQASGADALIHCGDLTSPEIVHRCAEANRPCYYVFGNMDFDLETLRGAIGVTGGTGLETGGLIDLDGRRIAVTHGHLNPELRRLERLEPDYLLSGHTHQRLDHRDGPTRRINPGALHRAREWTVALLDLPTDRLEILHVT